MRLPHSRAVDPFDLPTRQKLNAAFAAYKEAWDSKSQALFVEAENNLRKALQDAKANSRVNKNVRAQRGSEFMLSSVESGITL